MWRRSLGVRPRHVLRALGRRPAAMAAAGAALSLGIAANTVVFSIVNATLLQPLPYHDPDALVIATEQSPQSPALAVSYPDFVDWRRSATVFDGAAAQNRETFNLTGAGEPEQVFGSNVSASLFDVLGVKPFAGRLFRAADDEPGGAPVVVLTFRAWSERFRRDAGIVGRMIVLDGIPRTIIGVLPAGVRFPIGDERGEIFSPLGRIAAALGDRGAHPGLAMVARLKAGVSLEAARSDLDRVAAVLSREHPDTNKDVRPRLDRYRDRVTAAASPLLVALWAAVIAVLLVACASAAAVLSAQVAARRQEFAVRLSLGATRGQLVAQLLAESGTLAAVSAAAGLAAAAAALPWATTLLPADVPRLGNITLDGRVFAWTASITAVTALTAGIPPAWFAGATSLHVAGSERGSRSHRNARALFVVGQLALSQALLLAAGLLVATLAHLLSVNVGFKPEGVVTALYYLPDAEYASRDRLVAFHDSLLDRIRRLPGVAAAALLTPPPFGFGDSSSDVVVDGREGAVKVQSFLASPGMFATLGIPVVAGRDFDSHDRADAAPVVIVDERFAETCFGSREAAGRRLRIEHARQWATVVGVVGHIAAHSLDAAPEPQVYMPLLAASQHFTSIVARSSTANPSAVLPAIRKAVAAIDPKLPLFNAAPVSMLIEQSAGRARLAAFVFGAFAVSAWLLAAIGLAGVISGAVTSRTKELGIRLALGARPPALVAGIVSEGVRLTAIGLVAGLAAGFAAARALASLFVGVEPSDPLVVATAAFALALTGIVASYVPARRASRIDPASALNVSR